MQTQNIPLGKWLPKNKKNTIARSGAKKVAQEWHGKSWSWRSRWSLLGKVGLLSALSVGSLWPPTVSALWFPPAVTTPQANLLVQQAYCRVLERPADASGLKYYTVLLQTGRFSVKQLVRTLVNSTEHQQRFYYGKTSVQYVTSLYDHLLARSPDPEGLGYWVNQLPKSGWPGVNTRFLDNSPYEYNQRFGSTVVPGNGRSGCGLPPSLVTLTITKNGTGQGEVKSSENTLTCGPTCQSNYAPNSIVTLTATPTTGAVFKGWTGDCAGTNATVTVTTDKAKICTATFDLLPSPVVLTITKNGTGQGEVKSVDNIIACGSTCQGNYALNSTVTLAATPTTGSIFKDWTGDCTGTNATVTVTTDKAKICTATFDTVPITIETTPPATPVCTGSSFDVTIKAVQKGALPIDSAENIALKFNPLQLQVNRITNSGVLDDLLDASYDNANGTLNFTAGRWNSPAPTGSFDLFTINLTAIGMAGQTIMLDLQSTGMMTFNGESVPFATTDSTLTLSQCLRYDTKFQREQPRPHVSWQTPLDIYLTTSAGTKLYQSTSDNKGRGILTLEEPLSSSDYLCVKNSHTLANRVTAPFGDPIDFGTLLEGDAKNDNTVDMLDYSFLTSHQGCRGGANSKYDPQADFNVSNCVNTKDRDLLTANFKKPSACQFDSILGMYRHGQRSLRATLPTVAIGGTPLPSGLTAGSAFDYTVQVQATDAQAADGAAVYLNFDSTQLQVNSLTPGTSFDSTLENSFDNTTGEINFAAGVWDNPAPTQAVDLVTINFTVLQADSEPSLFVSTSEGRQTMIAAGGEEVTALNDEGDILLAPALPTTTVTPPPVTTGTYSTSGTIIDKLGQPIPGVSIQVGGQTTTTDDQGHWEINNLPAGEYTAVATKPGLVFVTQKCALDSHQQQTSCDFAKPTSVLKLKVTSSQTQQGENLSYLVTLTNTGAEPATGIMVKETLPANTTLVALESLNGGTCNSENLTCTLPDLAPGQKAELKVTVDNTLSGKLENLVTVTSDNYSADMVKTATVVKPYLSVTVTDSVDPVPMMGQLHQTYEVALNANASSPATGVTLAVKLPAGVEVQTATTATGPCDLSQLPTMTCPLPTLEVNSHQTVNADFVLKDPGLLVLTTEAKVTADNYLANTVRERTNIFVPDDLKVDAIFVLDTTASMQQEINGVKAAVKTFIDNLGTAQSPTLALITFKDDVKVEAFTQDPKVLLKVVDGLKVSGGGLCPEASVEALTMAVKHLKEGGTLLLSTDASPYDDADVTGLATLLDSQNMKFHALVTGDCSQEGSWNELMK